MLVLGPKKIYFVGLMIVLKKEDYKRVSFNAPYCKLLDIPKAV